jgi:DNA-binding NtrC family response regulator
MTTELRKSRRANANEQLTSPYGHLRQFAAAPGYPASNGETMHTEETTKTVIVVREARGLRVLWAHSIKAATALLNAAPDETVVVTELAARDGNWRDLVEEVRRIGKCIPVALVSPISTSELWWDAFECGVEEILPAPLSASRLCEYLGK